MKLAQASFGVSIAAAVLLLLWPVYSSGRTLLAVNGTWVLAPIFFPCAIALAPLVWKARAIAVASAIVLGAFVLIAGFSIGLFYLPAAILMAVAAASDQFRKYVR